jgi:hypothetical protein
VEDSHFADPLDIIQIFNPSKKLTNIFQFIFFDVVQRIQVQLLQQRLYEMESGKVNLTYVIDHAFDWPHFPVRLLAGPAPQ